jgi:hypothetical protein
LRFFGKPDIFASFPRTGGRSARRLPMKARRSPPKRAVDSDSHERSGDDRDDVHVRDQSTRIEHGNQQQPGESAEQRHGDNFDDDP